jgi:hypothetical protein
MHAFAGWRAAARTTSSRTQRALGAQASVATRIDKLLSVEGSQGPARDAAAPSPRPVAATAPPMSSRRLGSSGPLPQTTETYGGCGNRLNHCCGGLIVTPCGDDGCRVRDRRLEADRGAAFEIAQRLRLHHQDLTAPVSPDTAFGRLAARRPVAACARVYYGGNLMRRPASLDSHAMRVWHAHMTFKSDCFCVDIVRR